MTTPTSIDPFGARAPLGPGLPDLYRLDAVGDRIDLATLPVTIKILLENLLRHAGGPYQRMWDSRHQPLAPRVTWDVSGK